MSIRQGVNSDGELMRDFYVKRDELFDSASGGDSMTRQEFKDECDINVLMANYERTGVISHINSMPPAYLDVSDVPDLPKAIAVMQDAERAFMTLPARIRAEFDNDPVLFAEYAADPANLDRMREWKLAPPAPEKPADEIPPSAGSSPPPPAE